MRRFCPAEWCRPSSPAALVAFLAALTIVGCDFDATNPGAVSEEDLTTDASLTALVNGVAGQFNFAENMTIMRVGTLSQEFAGSGTWEALHMAANDGRILNQDLRPGELPSAVWNPLSVSLVMAKESVDLIQQHASDNDPRIARAQLYAGMAYLKFASIFCEAAYDGGPAVPASESYDRAEARLTDALQRGQAAGLGDIENMARLMRARLRLYTGDHEGAIADARDVPHGFLWEMTHSQSDRASFTWDLFDLTRSIAMVVVHPDFRNLDDPRVVATETGGVGQDGSTPVWRQEKYPSRSVNIPIARWQEARLIEAEILIERGDVAPAVSLMNEVRRAAGLEEFSAGMSIEEARETLRSERTLEFYIEGPHRVVDRARWGTFPDGWATCLPIPVSEVRANPNL